MDLWGCSATTSPRLPDNRWSWLVLVVSTLGITVIIGISLSYGVFLPVFLDLFDDSSIEEITAVGSVAQMLLFFCVPLCYKIIQLINFRRTAVLSVLVCALGLLVTSFIEKNASILFVTFSIPYGLGSSMIYTSCMFAIIKYFKRRQNLAIGIFFVGISLGILIFAPLIQVFLDNFGLKATFWILSGTVFILVLPVIVVMDTNVKDDTVIEENQQQQQQQLKNCLLEYFEIFKRPGHVISLVVIGIQSTAISSLAVYLVTYCIDSGLTAQQGANQFIVTGVTSIGSSILAGRIMDYKSVNPFHVNQSAALVMAVSLFLIQLANKYYHFIIFSLFYGFGIGMYYPTIPVLFLNTVEERLVKYAWPTGELISSIGIGIGPPFLGFIVGSSRKGFAIEGGIMMTSFLIPFLQYCFKPWRQVRQQSHSAPSDQVNDTNNAENLSSSKLNYGFDKTDVEEKTDLEREKRSQDLEKSSVDIDEICSKDCDLCWDTKL